jgi:NAD(P)H-hydrate epimerase
VTAQTREVASEPLPTSDPLTGVRLPLADDVILRPGLDLEDLALRWAPQSAQRAIGAEQMRGADARAQRLGIAGEWLMEQAGAAVAATALALLASAARGREARILVLCGPGNNGGDGLVAARHLAAAGSRCEVVLLATEGEPTTPDSRSNWQRLDGVDGISRFLAPRAHDVALFLNGIERAGLVIDALLGTGVRGTLREPIRGGVDVAVRAADSGVPVLAVDGPTALDLSTGEPSIPVVRADVTITYHRPKRGLLVERARPVVGRVLVAPIGIPVEADLG